MRTLKVLLVLLLGLLPAIFAAGLALLSYRSPVPVQHRPLQSGRANSLAVSEEYKGVPYAFKLGFVEFDDDGYLLDPAQEQALLGDIKTDVEQGPGFNLIVLFVHGWNHDAGMNDKNVGCFQEFLRAAAVMQGRYQQSSGRPHRVYGIYAGWPGVVYRDSAWQQATTFWGREAAVDRLAERGELLQLIIRISAIRNKAERRRVMFMVIGHSLGGRSLYRSLRPLMQNALASEDYSVHIPPIADLAVMVNPALTADDHKTLADMVASSTNASVAVPRFVIATSRSDSVLRRQFRWSRLIGTIVRGDYKLKADDRTTAIGVYEPSVTHKLSLEEIVPGGYENAEGNERCASMRFDELDVVNRPGTIVDKEELYRFDEIVHRNAQGKVLYKTALTSAELSAGTLMVVAVDGKIIPDHNDIFTAPFVDFVARMLNYEFFRAAQPP